MFRESARVKEIDQWGDKEGCSGRKGKTVSYWKWDSLVGGGGGGRVWIKIDIYMHKITMFHYG